MGGRGVAISDHWQIYNPVIQDILYPPSISGGKHRIKVV